MTPRPAAALWLCCALCAAPASAVDEKAREAAPLTAPARVELTAVAPLGALVVPLSAPVLDAGALPVAPRAPVPSEPAVAAPSALPASVLPAAAAAAEAFSPAQAVAPAAPELKADSSVEQMTTAGAVRFDRAGPVAQAEAETSWRFNEAPESYRRELAARGAPKVELTRVLSREGSSGVLFEAKLGEKTVAVKTYGSRSSQDWQDTLGYFGNEVRMGREMSRVLGPVGMAPRSYGEVDIGAGGNPSWAMDVIKGADPDFLSAEDARRLITPETLRQAARGIDLLRKAGLGGGDSPQPMILLRDQEIHGVPRKAGDVVFMDAGGLTSNRRIWKSPEDQAAELAFIRLRADQLLASDPGITIAAAAQLANAERLQLQERARKLARAALAAAPVSKPASADPAFDDYLKDQTGFGLAGLKSQGVSPTQLRQLRAAYEKERPPPSTDFPDGPPLPPVSRDAAKPSGRLKIRAGGKDSVVAVILNRKPGAMEATFLGETAGGAVAVKTAQYVSIEPKSEAEARKALYAEAASLRSAAAAAKSAGFPSNVSFPDLLGLGFMDEGLAGRIYGEAQRVPVLLMRRSPGVTLEKWLSSGRKLNARDFDGLVRAVKLLHASGLVHGDLNIGNILVREDAATGRQSFVLVDFGASRRKETVDASSWEAFKAEDLRELSDAADYFRSKGRLGSP